VKEKCESYWAAVKLGDHCLRHAPRAEQVLGQKRFGGSYFVGELFVFGQFANELVDEGDIGFGCWTNLNAHDSTSPPGVLRLVIFQILPLLIARHQLSLVRNQSIVP